MGRIGMLSILGAAIMAALVSCGHPSTSPAAISSSVWIETESEFGKRIQACFSLPIASSSTALVADDAWQSTHRAVESEEHDKLLFVSLETPNNVAALTAPLTLTSEDEATVYQLLPLSEEPTAPLTFVSFDREKGRAYIYAETTLLMPDVAPEIWINKTPAPVLRRARYEGTNTSLVCLSVAYHAAAPIACVELRQARELVAGWIGSTRHTVQTGPSQYGARLRIVRVYSEGETVQLELYNESDKKKQPIRLERVVIDGNDVSEAVGPLPVLPPDRHLYSLDSRMLACPLSSFRADRPVSSIRIEYSILGSDGTRIPGSRSWVQCGVDLKGEAVVGGENSASLLSFSALCHEGLRPREELRTIEVRRRSRVGRRQHYGVYAHLDETADPKRIWSVSRNLDLLELEFPKASTGYQPSIVDDLLSRLNLASSNSESRVTYMVRGEERGHTRGEPGSYMAWTALLALANGSRGFTVGSEIERSTTDDFTMRIPSLAEFVESRRDLFEMAEPVELCNSETHGVRAFTLAAGPDALLCILVNEWSTAQLGAAGRELGFATHRHPMASVVLRFPESWEGLSATEWLGCADVKVQVLPSGSGRLDVSEFNTGAIVILRNELSTASRKLTVSDLVLTTSPYVQCTRRVALSDRWSAEVSIQNNTPRDRPVTLRLDPRLADQPVPATQSVPAGGKAVVSVEFTKDPSPYGETILYAVIDEETQDRICNGVGLIPPEATVCCVPSVVDLGIYGDGWPERDVTVESLHGDLGPVEIIAVRASDRVAVDSRTGSAVVKIRPGANAMGPLNETVAISWRASDLNGETTFRVVGDRQSGLVIHPSTLLLPRTGRVTVRKLKVLGRVDLVADVETNGIVRRADWKLIDKTSGELEVRVFSQDDGVPEGNVTIRGKAGEVLATATARLLSHETTSAAEQDELMRQVEMSVKAAQEYAPDDETTPWALLHQLLAFEAGHSLSDAGTSRLHAIARALLDPRSTRSIVERTPVGLRPIRGTFPFMFEDHPGQTAYIIGRTRLNRSSSTVPEDLAQFARQLISDEDSSHADVSDLSWAVLAQVTLLNRGEADPPVPFVSLIENGMRLAGQPSTSCRGLHRVHALAFLSESIRPLAVAGVADLPIVLIGRASEAGLGQLRADLDQALVRAADTTLTGPELVLLGHGLECLTAARDARDRHRIRRLVTRLVTDTQVFFSSGPELRSVSDLQEWGIMMHAVGGLATWLNDQRLDRKGHNK